MRRLAAMGLAAALTLAAGEATAEGQDTQLYEDDGAPRALPEMGFPVRPNYAVRAAATFLATHGMEHARVMGGLRLEVPMMPQLFETPGWEILHLVGGIHGGSWGARSTSPFTYELGGGTRFRYDALAFFAFTLTPRVTFMHATSNDTLGLRTDLSLGMDIGRIMSIEGHGTFIKSHFELPDGSEERSWTAGGGGSVSFNFCSLFGDSCQHNPRAPITDDRSCDLYGLARDLCLVRDPQPVPKSNLCSVVEHALDTYEHPLLGRDPVRAFLESALDNANDKAAHKLQLLLDRHHSLRGWLDGGRQARTSAAREGYDLAVNRQYSPYPVEIAHALGCDGATSCENVCESY